MLDSAAFVHKRRHNIYFDDRPTELADNHPALKQFETINHTICADQIPGSLICRIYEWPPLATFLAAVLDKTELHLMADPLVRVNVIAYRAGEALNWHFDRSEFTTTLSLQSPARGGEFQYRDALRSDDDANYEGVGRLLAGEDDAVKTLPLPPGTLSVFKGKKHSPPSHPGRRSARTNCCRVFPTTKTVTWFLPKKSAWGSMAVPSNAGLGDEGNIRGSVDVTALRHERLAEVACDFETSRCRRRPVLRSNQHSLRNRRQQHAGLVPAQPRHDMRLSRPKDGSSSLNSRAANTWPTALIRSTRCAQVSHGPILCRDPIQVSGLLNGPPK